MSFPNELGSSNNELNNCAEYSLVRCIGKTIIVGEIGLWAGHGVSVLSGVAIIPLMPLLCIQYIFRSALEYALEGTSLKNHQISLIKAGVEAITCTAVILTCLAVSALAPPILGLVLGVSITYIAYNLYKAKIQYDEMQKEENKKRIQKSTIGIL